MNARQMENYLELNIAQTVRSWMESRTIFKLLAEKGILSEEEIISCMKEIADDELPDMDLYKQLQLDAAE
jgi:hypothetical protein